MSFITRQDAEALIPEQEIAGVIEGTIKQSKALKLFRKLPNMTSGTTKMKVLDNLPLAYFQTADTALKQTTEMAWKNKYIYAEEIAVIVPIAEATLDDADYDIWGEVKPRVEEAFGKLIDQAVFTGEGKPANWRAGLIESINQVGALVTPGSSDDLYTQVSDAMGKVEESGYDVTAILGGVSLKKAFRDLRDTTGNPIQSNEISSLTREFVDNGAWDKTKASLIVGDFSQAVYAIRQDITVKLLTEGVIQDADGKILYNLAQQDMVALRFVMRLGWEIPNPINALNDDESVRFPFACVKGTAALSTVAAKIKVTSDGTTAVSGAEVTFGGLVSTTGSDGIATFNVTSGKAYNYSVFAKGYKVLAGTVSSAAAATTTVTLEARSTAGKNPAQN